MILGGSQWFYFSDSERESYEGPMMHGVLVFYMQVQGSLDGNLRDAN